MQPWLEDLLFTGGIAVAVAVIAYLFRLTRRDRELARSRTGPPTRAQTRLHDQVLMPPPKAPYWKGEEGTLARQEKPVSGATRYDDDDFDDNEGGWTVPERLVQWVDDFVKRNIVSLLALAVAVVALVMAARPDPAPVPKPTSELLHDQLTDIRLDCLERLVNHPFGGRCP